MVKYGESLLEQGVPLARSGHFDEGEDLIYRAAVCGFFANSDALLSDLLPLSLESALRRSTILVSVSLCMVGRKTWRSAMAGLSSPRQQMKE